jgi:hypothetical protein
MGMDETVQSFLQTIKERPHVLQLINHTDLLLTLVSGNRRVALSVKNGMIYLPQDTDAALANCEISGDIPQLLEGKETLRNLVRKGKIQIVAPFRTVLLLESLFYLTKVRKVC